ncbi:permease-like cell division protein FtsX [Arhodomonas sp. AD133]|uniref:permease-like cell division protein FtsX n=1 Tax=Arhodomonas sp. AD133 TaxID=3415009 RepID=UPI003EB983B9
MAARGERRSWRTRLGIWGEHHARALVGALGRFRASLAPGLMTAAVIGISLALPAAFLLLMDNAEAIAGDWQGRTRMSVFLDKDLDDSAAQRLAEAVRGRGDVAGVHLMPPEEALAEFRAHTRLDRALALLEDNPLPAVLLVEPARGLPPADIEALATALKDRPESAEVRLDREWVQRLHAILMLLQRAVWLLTGLLGVAVVLVIGNTIRLDIENRREEIAITKLIGATDGFVRRPFLYAGLWYGLTGGVIASALVEGAYLLLSGPANALATSYGSPFRLAGLDAAGLATLIGCGMLLGLLGSWLAVGRHLAAIEPR